MSEHVLVADDDPAILGALATIVAMAGRCCRTAVNGKEAVEAATAEPPALVLLDFNMPVMNGIEAHQQLRALGIQAPSILMSADLKDLGQRAAAAGFDGYLSKPFSLAEVSDLLERFLYPVTHSG